MVTGAIHPGARRTDRKIQDGARGRPRHRAGSAPTGTGAHPLGHPRQQHHAGTG